MEKIKVFGIGLPKTGHTSLTEALRILGYKSAKATIGCLNTDLSLKYDILDKFEALTDTPLTKRYVDLDNKYDAKFILLTRNINTWLKSCENWFSFENMSKAPDYFLLHKSIFGDGFYNKELFIKVFIDYYNTLYDYFTEGYSTKYIILDICSGDGWKEICEFLKKDIPNIKFPHLNKREG